MLSQPISSRSANRTARHVEIVVNRDSFRELRFGAVWGTWEHKSHAASTAGWREGTGLIIEVFTVSLSAIAIIVSLWSAVKGQRETRRSAQRQSEWQERVLALEEAEARQHSTAAQSAKLRVGLDRSARSLALLVSNDGAAEARNISVKIDGTPILEHRIVMRGQNEAHQLGPGGSVRYILALTMGIPHLIQVEIRWADEAGEAQRWSSDLSLI